MGLKVTWTPISADFLAPSIEGRLLCSERDPKKEAQNWWTKNSSEVQGLTAVVVLGLGAGLHVQEILSAQQAPSVVFVIERESEIILNWQKRNPQLAAQVQFLPVGDELQMHPSSDVGILEFRPAWVGHEKFYSTISESLRGSTIHQVVSQLNHHDQSTEAKIWRALRELVA